MNVPREIEITERAAVRKILKVAQAQEKEASNLRPNHRRHDPKTVTSHVQAMNRLHVKRVKMTESRREVRHIELAHIPQKVHRKWHLMTLICV